MKRLLPFLGLLLVGTLIAAELDSLPDWAQTLPPEFHHTFLRIQVWQWLAIASLILASTIIGLAGRSFARSLTRLRDRFAPAPMTGSIRDGIGRACGLIVSALIATALIPDLVLPENFTRDLTLLCQGLLVVGCVLMADAWWEVVCDAIATRTTGHERAERLLVPMTRKLVRVVIITTGILVAIGIFGGTKTITSLIATLGISSLVVALAAKDSVENLFGSLTILFDMPFALGDLVKIDKVEGVIEEINLRSTRIRTFEDTLITLPNANLIRASVENFGLRRTRRQRVTLRVSYENESEKLDLFIQQVKEFISANTVAVPNKTLVVLVDPLENSVGLLVEAHLPFEAGEEEMGFRSVVLNQAIKIGHSLGIQFSLSTPLVATEKPLKG